MSTNQTISKTKSAYTLLLIAVITLASSGVTSYFVSTGQLSQEQADLINRQVGEQTRLILDSLAENITAVQEFLSTAWNPTYYSTMSEAFDYSIVHPDGVNSELWYSLKKGSTGASVLNTQNSTQAMSCAVGNLTDGGWICLNADVAWNSAVTIPAGVFVVEYLNTTGITVYDQYGSSKLSGLSGRSDYDYMVFTETIGGTTYYFAKNGTDGSISFSSTDASIVLQSAFNACPTNTLDVGYGFGEVTMRYGKIVLDVGYFVGHSIIQIDKYSRVEWEGQGVGRSILKINGTGINSWASSQGAFNYTNTAGMVGEIGGNHAVRTQTDFGAEVNIHDMSIDVTQEQYLCGIWVQTLDKGLFYNLEINGYYINGTLLNTLTGTPFTAGIYYYNSTLNIDGTIHNVISNGFHFGFLTSLDHLKIYQCTADYNAIAYYFDGCYDIDANDLHVFENYFNNYVFTSMIRDGTFNNLNCAGITSTSGSSSYQLYTVATYLHNVYITNLHVNPVVSSRLFGGNINLAHFSGSTWIEQIGTVTLNNNASVDITFKDAMYAAATYYTAYDMTAPATSVTVSNVTATGCTLTVASPCNDTIAYTLKLYP